MSGYLSWHTKNADDIEFLRDLQKKGRKTALDIMPELNSDSIPLWNMYCVMGEDALVSLDVYEKRIGLPDDWTFNECLNLVNRLQSEHQKLVKVND